MADGTRDGPPVVEYEPVGDRNEWRPLVTGYVAALGIAVALVAGSAFAGSWIDARRNPDAHLAGLAGLIVGACIGIVLVIATAAATLAAARHRRSAILRGVGAGAAGDAGTVGVNDGDLRLGYAVSGRNAGSNAAPRHRIDATYRAARYEPTLMCMPPELLGETIPSIRGRISHMSRP